MEANVRNLSGSPRIPAGIFSGTEIFTQGGEIYAMYQGSRTRFEELPGMEKRMFINEYLEDKEGQKFIRETFGVVGFESGFKQWLFCKFGSLDGDPDGIDGKITPDSYNSACSRTDCTGRGKFCGCAAGLKGYEVDTLREIVAGRTVKEIAEKLNVSVSAVKSRVEKLKERHSVANVVALAALAAELGI